MKARTIGRRVLLSALLSLPVLTVPPAAHAQGVEQAVIAPIQNLDQSLLTVMKQGRATPFQQRVATLTPAVERALNLPEILQRAVGPAWVTLSPQDQARLLSVFRTYTVATYVENFDSYDGQQILVQPQTRSLPDGAQVVRSEIVPRNGRPTHEIDYVMRRDPAGEWKATDILADGAISRVAVLRSDFSTMLARGGVSALEASLQQKTQALEQG